MAPAHLFQSALALSDLERFYREVRHTKVHADDCINCGEGRSGKLDQFERRITFETDPGPEVTEKIARIAGKCPVHRTLEARSHIVMKVITANA